MVHDEMVIQLIVDRSSSNMETRKIAGIYVSHFGSRLRRGEEAGAAILCAGEVQDGTSHVVVVIIVNGKELWQKH